MRLAPPTTSPTATTLAVQPGARVYDKSGFDSVALARVSQWVAHERDMFVRAGLTDAAQLPPIRVDFAPFSPVAEMRTEQGSMLLGTYTRRNLPASVGADLVRHEYAHYVLDHTVLPHRLASEQAAAMHESLADTFASVLDDDWTLGEDFFPDGRVTRSMQEPAAGIAPVAWGARTLPDHVGDVQRGDEAHTQAGIPNRAAYLIGSVLGRERLASLYVDALTQHLDRDLGFDAFAGATLAAARDDHERTIIRDAWSKVGIALPVA
ncbi:MAG: flagellar biosynthesis protein FlgM [Thermoleophilia bacterium]|nr:flagellar biosynthesis protein FlgM [Thermoleophilia bacterium]